MVEVHKTKRTNPLEGRSSMATMVDSKQRKLNTFEIVHTSLVDSAPTPEVANDSKAVYAQLMGAITELSQPNTKVKQFGNTLFAAHIAPERRAFVRAFNADTAANFIKSIMEFFGYAYTKLGLDTLVIPGMQDTSLARLIDAALRKPFQKGMGYQLDTRNPDNVIAVLQLGPKRT